MPVRARQAAWPWISIPGFSSSSSPGGSALRCQRDPDQVDGAVADISRLVLLAQGDGMIPADGTGFRGRHILFLTVLDVPLATLDVHVKLVSRMRMNALPCSGLHGEPLHDEAVVFKLKLPGDIRVDQAVTCGRPTRLRARRKGLQADPEILDRRITHVSRFVLRALIDGVLPDDRAVLGC